MEAIVIDEKVLRDRVIACIRNRILELGVGVVSATGLVPLKFVFNYGWFRDVFMSFCHNDPALLQHIPSIQARFLISRFEDGASCDLEQVFVASAGD